MKETIATGGKIQIANSADMGEAYPRDFSHRLGQEIAALSKAPESNEEKRNWFGRRLLNAKGEHCEVDAIGIVEQLAKNGSMLAKALRDVA